MPSTAKFVISCIIGNLLEFYDFILYGIFAVVIAQHFFPNHYGLLSTFTVLAVGYFARPLGGLLFGHFGDKYSRRKTLIISLLIMGAVTALMGLLPDYASIGIIATVLLVLLRLIQGLTVGGESAGSMVFLLENAEEKSSKWRACLSVCALLGAVLGVLLALCVSRIIAGLYSHEAIMQYAWRIPFLLGAVLAAVGVYLRSRFWQDRILHHEKLPLKVLFNQQAGAVITAILFLCLPAVFTGFSSVYLVSYLMIYLHFTVAQAVQINIWLMLTMFVFLLISAYLADRLQCYKQWIVVTLMTTIIVIYPLLNVVTQGGRHAVMSLMVLTAIVSSTMGPEVVLLVGFFKKTVRYSGVGFSHGFAFSVMTGTSPLVFNYVTTRWGMVAVAYYLILAAVVSLIAVVFFSVTPAKPGTYDFPRKNPESPLSRG